MVPGGATTVIARNVPEVIGHFGSRKDFTTVMTEVGAMAGPAFRGAATWAELPVKSAVR